VARSAQWGMVISVPVRVKPGASRAKVGGRHDGPHGAALVIAVNAPAIDGRATEAARRALAVALGVRPVTVIVRLGLASRDKLFAIEDAPTWLAERVRELRDGPMASAG